MHTSKPVVLCFSGLDPSGGAGLQADGETLASLGCHCAPVATAVTVQDTVNARRMEPVATDLIREQALAVLADFEVKCIKLGLIGDTGAVDAVCAVLHGHGTTPVVWDPVGAAGGGFAFSDEALLATVARTLPPLATIATPNSVELRQLAPKADSAAAAADELLRRGCGHVLLTGGHDPGAELVNTWYAPGCTPREFRWPRLRREFRGSGCTLASAVAANLALGRTMADALGRAQEFTWHALDHAFRAGAGRYLPDRTFRRGP